MKNNFPCLAAALAAAIPSLSAAQATEPAKAAPPQLTYRSAFGDYKPYQEMEPGNWRAVNDAVGAAASKQGSHAGHGVEPDAPASASGRSSPGAQQRHPMHGGKQ